MSTLINAILGLGIFAIVMVLVAVVLSGLYHLGICKIYGYNDSSTKVKCFVPILQNFVSVKAHPTKAGRLYLISSVALIILTVLSFICTILLTKIGSFIFIIVSVISGLIVICSIVCYICYFIWVYSILSDCGINSVLAVISILFSIVQYIMIAFILPGKSSVSNDSSGDTFISFN